MKEIKGFIKLATRDICDHYEISKGAVVLIQQIYFYQCGALRKCIASKDTLAKSAKLSRRQTYDLLKILQRKGLIVRKRREILVSTSFLRWLTWLKGLHSACQYWSDHFRVKLQWLWKKCGQSIIRLHKKLFNCTSAPQKPHPNNRLKSSSDFNKNNSVRKLSFLDIKKLILQLSAEQIKELYLEKLFEKNKTTDEHR
ncbi:MAG: hypothetical protein KGZ86_00915 [Candidatus Latescibacteria bacterium]|nr:hypothetical protein [Candidatus Latescibacterota bacterium]